MDLPDMIFLSFRYLNPHVHVLRVVVPNAVAKDCGIAITQLVVFLDEFFLVFFPTLRRKLLRLEERRQLASLVCLGERAFPEQSALDA